MLSNSRRTSAIGTHLSPNCKSKSNRVQYQTLTLPTASKVGNNLGISNRCKYLITATVPTASKVGNNFGISNRCKNLITATRSREVFLVVESCMISCTPGHLYELVPRPTVIKFQIQLRNAREFNRAMDAVLRR
jgi:hypothetical protein